VFLHVHEDVDERVADGARIRELARMEAVAPKAATNLEQRIHVSRDADGETLCAT